MRGARIIVALLAHAYAAQAVTMPGAGGGRALYLPILRREAAAVGLPPELADAVAMVETGYRPDAVGSSGEIGIMQVMPATARQLGFFGSTAELADPETNIRLGVRYLARAWALGGGDVCRTLTKYRAGAGRDGDDAAIGALLHAGGHLARQHGERPCAPRRAAARHAGTGGANGPLRIAILPALAAQARLRPMLAAAHEMMASLHPHRLVADRYRALNDRFLSHQRHYGRFPKAAEPASDSDD